MPVAERSPLRAEEHLLGQSETWPYAHSQASVMTWSTTHAALPSRRPPTGYMNSLSSVPAYGALHSPNWLV